MAELSSLACVQTFSYFLSYTQAMSGPPQIPPAAWLKSLQCHSGQQWSWIFVGKKFWRRGLILCIETSFWTPSPPPPPPFFFFKKGILLNLTYGRLFLTVERLKVIHVRLCCFFFFLMNNGKWIINQDCIQSRWLEIGQGFFVFPFKDCQKRNKTNIQLSWMNKWPSLVLKEILYGQ